MKYEWDPNKNKANLEKHGLAFDDVTSLFEDMDDKDIDYSDIPPLNEKFFEQASIYVPAGQRATAVQLDDDVYTWFKDQSEEYQSLINLILRKYMELREESPSYK